MNQIALIILFGSLAVIVFDTIGSLASRKFGFNYSYLIIGSLSIYATVGFLTAKYEELIFAIFAGGITGLVDSTLGWYISWVIGPGRPPWEVNPKSIFTAILTVIILSAATAYIGGIIEKII